MKNKILCLAVCFALLPEAAALNFDSPAAADAGVFAALRPAPVSELSRLPVAGLWAERLSSSKLFVLDDTAFLAWVSFDSEWNLYFELKAEEACPPNGSWREEALEAGVSYRYRGGTLAIRSVDGFVLIEDGKGGSVSTSMGELFDLLYAGSSKVKFADMVEYAVIRNSDPESLAEGTVTMRIGSDGLYYYSLTPDAHIIGQPRWLLAINGVLYGLKYAQPDLVFVSKEIEMKEDAARERVFRKR